jgi:hypothetical protein
LINNSGLSHSYWAKAAAYSIYTCNLIPSQHIPGRIPLKSFTKRRQGVGHLHVFGAKCWAKIPAIHGLQVTGGLKLDPRSVECCLLGYATGTGNYKVQDVNTHWTFISCDLVFEEGQPRHTLASVGEKITLFDNYADNTPLTNSIRPDHDTKPDRVDHLDNHIDHLDNLHQVHHDVDQCTPNKSITIVEQFQSTRVPQLLNTGLQSLEYRECEVSGKNNGQD